MSDSAYMAVRQVIKDHKVGRLSCPVSAVTGDTDPGYMSRQNRNLERINYVRETNGSELMLTTGSQRFSLVPRVKLVCWFVSRIESIRSKL